MFACAAIASSMIFAYGLSMAGAQTVKPNLPPGLRTQREVGQDTIEAGLSEREILRVAFAEFDLRKHFLRDRDHLLRKIETGGDSAAFRSGSRDITRSATDIQDRHLLSNFRRLEQGRNELTRGCRPNGIVFVHDALPA